jgi:hypothetical protein
MVCFNFFIEKGTFHEKICRLQIGALPYRLHAIPMELIIPQSWILVETQTA